MHCIPEQCCNSLQCSHHEKHSKSVKRGTWKLMGFNYIKSLCIFQNSMLFTVVYIIFICQIKEKNITTNLLPKKSIHEKYAFYSKLWTWFLRSQDSLSIIVSSSMVRTYSHRTKSKDFFFFRVFILQSHHWCLRLYLFSFICLISSSHKIISLRGHIFYDIAGT